MKKRAILTLLFFIVVTGSLYGQTRSIVGIDTPTAFTLGRGAYMVSLLGYDSGGVELKTVVGLHDNFYMGVSFDVQHAIGKETPKPNIPGVIARIKFTDGWDDWPISLAMGYDSFFIGEQGKTDNPNNSLDRMIYGPYFAVTKPIYLFGGEQYFSFGVRMPIQPYFNADDTSYYVALDFPLGDVFNIKGEVERIYWNLRDPDEWLLNFGFRYTYLEQLSIELDFLYQPGESLNRILRIEYHDRF